MKVSWYTADWVGVIQNSLLTTVENLVTEPEWVIYTWKLSDIMYIQNCSNYGSQGLGGATIGKTIFTRVYIEKKISSSRTSRPISIPLCTKFILGWMRFWIVQIKVQFLIKGEIIIKMGWGHLKISWTTELEKVIFTWKLSDIM
jgi:hypothetical protein